MIEEAKDFLAESDAIAEIVAPLSDEQLSQETLFKSWTIEDVIAHLHIWNHAAELTLEDPEKFGAFIQNAMMHLMSEGGHLGFQKKYLDGLGGKALVEEWRASYPKIAEKFLNADPTARLEWAGPDMSAQSCIIARQMENWAHGFEVFDLLGCERVETDRIRNIVVLGVNTFGWSHKVHGLDVPEVMPLVRVTAPSGAVWDWGDAASGRIEGPAVDFAAVVTQTRALADTGLVVEGDVAETWMAHAQCFAGGAEKPPVAGSRFKG